MPFTPIIPFSGLAGWRFVETTFDRQIEAFRQSPDIQRDVDHFKSRLADPISLEEFLSDRQLLRVALGAFGLSEEVDKRAFVRRILEEGPSDNEAFAVRLNNPDYLDFAEAFRFDLGDVSLVSVTADRIAAMYERQSFDEAVGEQNNAMRLALNFERKAVELANEGFNETTGWFKVLGSVPLRRFLETSFGLPSEFSGMDIDRQVEILSEKTRAMFGEGGIDVFANPENLEVLTRRFFLFEQISAGPSPNTPGYAALTLLGSGLGAQGSANLLLSNSL